jgi:hypothetical protein
MYSVPGTELGTEDPMRLCMWSWFRHTESDCQGLLPWKLLLGWVPKPPHLAWPLKNCFAVYSHPIYL